MAFARMRLRFAERESHAVRLLAARDVSGEDAIKFSAHGVIKGTGHAITIFARLAQIIISICWGGSLNVAFIALVRTCGMSAHPCGQGSPLRSSTLVVASDRYFPRQCSSAGLR